MSAEVFGDEGNVAERGEDTAMYQDLLAISGKLDKWVADRERDPLPNNECEQLAAITKEKMDDLLYALTGEL